MIQNCPNFIPILMVLLAFGVIYNRWIEHLENRGHDRGYMGLIVAFGCTVTLFGASLDRSYAGLDPITWVFVCFAASGTPMVIGSIVRHCRARARHQADALEHNEHIIQGRPENGRPKIGGSDGTH